MNKGTTRTYHYKDIKAMKLNIIALLLFLVLAVNSRLILPDMDMILNSDLPSSAYGGKSQCDTYSIKLGLKLAKLVWDVLNDVNQLLPDIREAWQLAKDLFLACLLLK
eukprot:TRINITY_DN12936_c0_g1_i7.p1 TRINITY_DN12936_c0_g1~~TRINITY_DN12936_c0_g1_i7.p1  ORF type:complete len:108 (-),score=26.06 TRINITY_DN12936_c0_g1_i7:111-434(-)